MDIKYSTQFSASSDPTHPIFDVSNTQIVPNDDTPKGWSERALDHDLDKL